MVFTPTLTIRALRPRAVNVPLARPHPTAGGAVTSAPLVLLDLETDEGITGYSYVFVYTPLALVPVTCLLENLASLVTGATVAPLALERALHARFRLLGPQGFTGIAMAAIDMAAWDVLARAAGLPLVRFLGSEPRPVPAYHSLGMGGAEAAAREAAESVAAGYRAVKFKVGYPAVAGEWDVIRAARDAGGADLQVMIDYNQSLSVPEAVARIEALADAHLTWVEEPTSADDFAGHARIAAAVRTPIQIGENWWGTHDMLKSISVAASDYVMADVMKIGGVTGWLRAAALAEAHGLCLSSHLFPEISAHLLAASPTMHWLEYSDWVNPILETPLRIEAGHAHIADTPGSGVAWRDDVVRQYLVS